MGGKNNIQQSFRAVTVPTDVCFESGLLGEIEQLLGGDCVGRRGGDGWQCRVRLCGLERTVKGDGGSQTGVGNTGEMDVGF